MASQYTLMVYYGQVDSSISDPSKIYEILIEALSRIPDDYPYRGPKTYEKGKYLYKNKYEGTVDSFSGGEVLSSMGLQFIVLNMWED